MRMCLHLKYMLLLILAVRTPIRIRKFVFVRILSSIIVTESELCDCLPINYVIFTVIMQHAGSVVRSFCTVRWIEKVYLSSEVVLQE